ncbi:MAG: OmpA family protein [Rhizobacter sp.]|nr:OmpA family protein [Ferruginibacter sp.]
MTKAVSFLLLLLFVQTANGQSGILNRAKQSVKNKVNQKIDQKIDKSIDKAISKADTVITTSNGNTTDAATKGRQDKSTVNGQTNFSATGTLIKANSKFDFVAGEKILAFEDFGQDAVGDFPDKWNTTSSGEIKTFNGQKGKWLALMKPGIFYPEYIKTLPDNFTLEYDVAASNNYNVSSAWFEISVIKVANEDEMKTVVSNSGDRFRFSNSSNGISIRIHPNYDQGSYYYRTFENGSEQQTYTNKQNSFTDTNNIVHISIWKQKTRIRMYINQEKIIDLPKVMTSTYNKIIFSPSYSYANNDDMLYLTNVRLAVGDADTRNKLITEGKFVSHGILFESGSDKINPQSYGALKEIAAVLNDNAALKVKIVGHTDSDGDDANNLRLSEKRAAAVKNTLTDDFKIDAARMETSGKGETVPMEPNTTTAGKANNRRVEFIKL